MLTENTLLEPLKEKWYDALLCAKLICDQVQHQIQKKFDSMQNDKQKLNDTNYVNPTNIEALLAAAVSRSAKKTLANETEF